MTSDRPESTGVERRVESNGRHSLESTARDHGEPGAQTGAARSSGAEYGHERGSPEADAEPSSRREGQIERSSPEAGGLDHEPSRRPFAEIRYDGPASVVVALVALPLCLGIALASGAPLLAGLVTGIVGGIIVPFLSGSSLAVSGPAAGLTVIVLTAINELGSYEAFVLAVIIGGALQTLLGFLRAGIFGYYIPSSVIRGMLAAIGLILILKQIPHAVGFHGDYEGDLSFQQPDGRNTLTEIPYALGHFHMGALLISTAAMWVLILAPRIPVLKRIRLLPPPLLAVLVGILVNALFRLVEPSLAANGDLLVQIPVLSGLKDLVVATPDISQLSNPAVYKVAGTLAIIASIETLLCIEAVDKLDPFKRISPANRELRAQGVGNMVAGLLGGLPMTAVIVRGSANVHSGGRTPTSAFLHGVWLLMAVLFIPGVLNAIPLAALAAVLLHVGYKLSPISLFRQLFRQGTSQFLPFLATVLGILFTDLLVGVLIGLVVGVFFILKANLQTPYFHEEKVSERDGRTEVRIGLSENVSFLNKAAINQALHDIPENAFVRIDGSGSLHIDHDVVEIIHEFASSTAPSRNITVDLVDIPDGAAALAH